MSSRILRLVGIVILIATLGAVSCQAFFSADEVAKPVTSVGPSETAAELGRARGEAL